jgi:hypothetical protein
MNAETIDTLEPAAGPSWGPTILGGVIGAAVGIIIHVAIETGGGMHWRPIEASWFAIVIGVLTGLGVRQMNKHHMERSYLRGAISGAIALGAIVLSTFLISIVMARFDALNKAKPAPAVAEAPKEGASEKGDIQAAATEPAAVLDERGAAGVVGGIGRVRQDKLNPWQFVFMAVGALAAYELGRGVDHSRRAEAAAPTIGGEPMPVATDPSH